MHSITLPTVGHTLSRNSFAPKNTNFRCSLPARRSHFRSDYSKAIHCTARSFRTTNTGGERCWTLFQIWRVSVSASTAIETIPLKCIDINFWQRITQTLFPVPQSIPYSLHIQMNSFLCEKFHFSLCVLLAAQRGLVEGAHFASRYHPGLRLPPTWTAPEDSPCCCVKLLHSLTQGEAATRLRCSALGKGSTNLFSKIFL